jgi:hypothetical protein
VSIEDISIKTEVRTGPLVKVKYDLPVFDNRGFHAGKYETLFAEDIKNLVIAPLKCVKIAPIYSLVDDNEDTASCKYYFLHPVIEFCSYTDWVLNGVRREEV